MALPRLMTAPGRRCSLATLLALAAISFLLPPTLVEARVSLNQLQDRIDALEGEDKAAPDQLVILEVQDLGASVVIRGVNLDKGPDLDVLLGDQPLSVIGTPNDVVIEADLPGGVGAGSYTLSVRTGEARTQFDAFEVALGEIGPTGPTGPIGPPGPAGDPGFLDGAGKRCAAGQVAVGLTVTGDLICESNDVCAGVQCLPHQTCEIFGEGAAVAPYCADTCDGFRCDAGSHCALQAVSCIRAPCPPVARCVADDSPPDDPADPCSTVRCQSGQVCKVHSGPNGPEPYCADTCEGEQCPAGQTCRLREVQCVRAPCPPVRVCEEREKDPCATTRCVAGAECRVYDGPNGPVPYCAETCDSLTCGADEICELQDVVCVTEPCPPVPHCAPRGTGGRDVCALAPETGPCRASIPRWYHDPDSGVCRRFIYGGCGGNGNSFATLNECASACGSPTDACDLPAEAGPCKAAIPRFFHDADTLTCKQFIYGGCQGNANNFTTQAACEVACDVAKGDRCALPPDIGPCKAAIPRWFNNPRTQTCEPFTWGGCGGNANNFATRTACEKSCGGSAENSCKVDADRGPCTAALPRWYHNDDSGHCERFTYGGCGGNDNNFGTRADCEATCEPAMDVCTLPAEVGPCRAAIPRWYHDDATDTCRTFVYGGCAGNENNFLTRAACERRCPVAETGGDACNVPADPGPCDGAFPRWAHNRQTGVCERFIYGGCAGNANNYPSQASCRRACGTAEETDACTLRPDVGPCDASIERWYADPETGACESFNYGGCGGNANNFNSREQCESACKPEIDTCALPRDAGPCKGAFQRWHYDARTDGCAQFTYGGCGGNGNNFESEWQCRSSCGSSDLRDSNEPR